MVFLIYEMVCFLNFTPLNKQMNSKSSPNMINVIFLNAAKFMEA